MNARHYNKGWQSYFTLCHREMEMRAFRFAAFPLRVFNNAAVRNSDKSLPSKLKILVRAFAAGAGVSPCVPASSSSDPKRWWASAAARGPGTPACRQVEKLDGKATPEPDRSGMLQRAFDVARTTQQLGGSLFQHCTQCATLLILS